MSTSAAPTKQNPKMLTVTVPSADTGSDSENLLSTGSDTGSQRSPGSVRRSVAFYPNMKSSNKPQKPFSRSAAKRESVMALGSIEHLQHYFTKTGIAAEKNPLSKPHSGAVPAIGGPSGTSMLLGNIRNFELPPSPIVPQIIQPAFPPFVKTYETDPENLRPGVIQDLSAVAAGWRLEGSQPADSSLISGLPGEHIDVLELLKTTTHAVRSVRNYIVSLPDESSIPSHETHFRPHNLQSAPLPKRRVSQPDSAKDPLTLIRRGTLEVLAVLRELEEHARLPLEDEAYDARSESEHSSQGQDATARSRAGSPSEEPEPHAFGDADAPVSISVINVHGREKPIPVWEDEAYDMNSTGEEGKRDRWEDRLVVGGGWLYKQDLRLEDLGRQRDIVRMYVNAVDDVLFGGPAEGKRGWERERERVRRKELAERGKRRVSAGDAQTREGPSSRRSNRRVVSTNMLDAMRDMVVTEEPEEMTPIFEHDEEDAVDDDDLPEWAKRSTFADNPLGRAQALLQALLPAYLKSHLPPSPDRSALLQALYSGQLLCTAYNVGVRKSRKPWGFVNKNAIHDVAALEAQVIGDASEGEKARRSWTFRRTDNLQLWAAALKLRYQLPIATPAAKARMAKDSHTPTGGATPAGSPSLSSIRFPGVEPEDVLVFDAPLVARQDEGWEEMLEAAFLKWVDAVVDERRGER